MSKRIPDKLQRKDNHITEPLDIEIEVALRSLALAVGRAELHWIIFVAVNVYSVTTTAPAHAARPCVRYRTFAKVINQPVQKTQSWKRCWLHVRARARLLDFLVWTER